MSRAGAVFPKGPVCFWFRGKFRLKFRPESVNGNEPVNGNAPEPRLKTSVAHM